MQRYLSILFLIIFGQVHAINATQIIGHVDAVTEKKIVIRFAEEHVGSVGDIAEVSFITIDGHPRIVGRWQIETVQGLLAVARPNNVFEKPGIGQPVVVLNPSQAVKITAKQAENLDSVPSSKLGRGEGTGGDRGEGAENAAHPAKYLPNFIGLSVSKAAAIAKSRGLVPEFELGEETSDPKKEGVIYHQTPSPETKLDQGSHVTLLVHTLAAILPKVPNVIGKSPKVASSAVIKAGLNPVFELGKETREKKKEGIIYHQNPASGTNVETGSDVIIKTYSFVADSLKVPTLIALPLVEAQRTLQKTGLRMSANLAGAAPNRSKEGRISRQKPEPGQEIKNGATVEIWVYGEYAEGEPPTKEKAPPAETTSEYCSLGKSGFIYQPAHGYYVFRSREPRKITNKVYSRSYQIVVDYSTDSVRKIQQEGKMELVSEGPLQNFCPHLREKCPLSTLNHADGSFFKDLCGKWDDPVQSSTRNASVAGWENTPVTTAVPFITIPKSPENETKIWISQFGQFGKTEPVKAGQRYGRPANGFLQKNGWREFWINYSGGVKIAMAWQENSDNDSAPQNTNPLMHKNSICNSEATSTPLYTPSKKIEFVGAGATYMYSIASVSLSSQSRRARVAILEGGGMHAGGWFLEKNQANFYHIAENLLAQIEPHAKTCKGKIK